MWILGDKKVRAFAGTAKAEKIAQGSTILWSRLAASGLAGSSSSNTEVTLTWNNISNITVSFELLRSTSSDFSGAITIPIADPTRTNFVDTGLAQDTTYYYKIKGIYPSNQESDFSNTASVLTADNLNAPSNFSGTATSNTEIDLSWTDSSNNEDGFKIYRSTTSGVQGSEIADLPAGTQSYSDSNLLDTTTYYYEIVSYNSRATSTSILTSVQTQSGLVDPTLTASQSGNSITLSIGDNTNIETSFTIERSSSSASVGFTAIASIPSGGTGTGSIIYSNSFDDDGSGNNQLATANLVVNTTYYYRVKAATSLGDTAYSNVETVTYSSITVNSDVLSSVFTGNNEIVFEYIKDGNYISGSGHSTFIYELATDSSFSNIVETVSRSSFASQVFFRQLSPNTTYYTRLRINGLLDTSSGIVQSYSETTTPCTGSISVTDDGYGSQTVTVNGLSSSSTYFLTEYTNGAPRGALLPVAYDESSNTHLGVINSTTSGGGRATVVGSFAHYVGYLPSSISSYGSGTHWSSSPNSAGGNEQWTQSMSTFLSNGGDIYDSNEIPTQFSFLYNALRYLARPTNPTNKVLYINDYKNGTSSSLDFPYLGAHKFYNTFKDIATYAGFTSFDQLPVNTGAGNTWLHHDAIETLYSTSNDWLNYFNGYDLIIYVGANGDSAGYSASVSYLPDPFVEGLLSFMDSGGGCFFATDHAPTFTVSINKILSNFGVFAEGSIDRTDDLNEYLVSDITSLTRLLPQGGHPFLTNIDPNSYIKVGLDESYLAFDRGQKAEYIQIANTSAYTTNSDGDHVASSHNTSSAIGMGSIFVQSANGCFFYPSVVVDTDGDGVPDSTDQDPNDPKIGSTTTDSDQDGVTDDLDSDPFNPNVASTTDTDGDGVDDFLDLSPNDSSTSGRDSDWDGIDDAVDTDKDNDGYDDSVDADPLNPFVFTGDSDGDGVDSTIDPDDNDTSVGVYRNTAGDAPIVFNDYRYAVSNSDLTSYHSNPETYNGGTLYSSAYSKYTFLYVPVAAQGCFIARQAMTTGYTNTMADQFVYFNPLDTPIPGRPNVGFDTDPYGTNPVAYPAPTFFRLSMVKSSSNFSSSYNYENNIVPIPYLDSQGKIFAMPFEWGGYYPLYSSAAEASARSPSGTSHSHNFTWNAGTQNAASNIQWVRNNAFDTKNVTSTRVFYMPDGLTAANGSTNIKQYLTHYWHGTHPGFPVWSRMFTVGSGKYDVLGPMGGAGTNYVSTDSNGNTIYPDAVIVDELKFIKDSISVTVT
jgi:hypothetical protein